MTKGTIKLIDTLAILIVLFFAQVQAQSQDRWFLNPGVKLGYAFGDNGGVIGGIEVSVTRYPESGKAITGVCFSVDKLNSTLFIHAAFEATSIAGASVGPSIMISDKRTLFGFTTTAFGGFFILPYFRYTYLPSRLDFWEAGTFLKVPVRLSGPDYNLGG